MNPRQILQYGVLSILLALGVWLIARPAQVQPETQARFTAVRAMAPAGLSQGQEEDAPELGQLVVMDPAYAHVVDFANVDPNAPHGDSMYERWLRGEIDLDENDSILSAAEVAALQAAAMRMGVTEGVQIAESGPGLQAPVPAGVSFDSMDYNNSGGSVPPDPEMAVGPNHIIAVVNVAVAMYDKSGNTVFGPVPAGSLYSQSPCTSGLYDPNVLYDEEADRWIIAFDQGPFSTTGGYCLLASQTGNPLGTWNEYFFHTNSAAGWLDYPHAGVGDNFIFMGGNIFTLGGSYVEGRVYAFNKANLYAGAPVSAIAQGLTATYDTPQPINLHGASTGTWPNWGNTHYLMAEPYDGINYTLFEWDTATLTNRGNLAIGTGGFPVDVVQSGGSNIQANDWRPLDFEYRNGYGWTTATNACNPGGGTVNCLLWVQVDLANATLGPAGSGIYSSSGDYRFFPDLAVNHCDDMVLGYTKSNSSIFPSVWVTGRQSGDPAGQLQAEIQMKAGEIAYLAFDPVPRRWGDYTGMTIDPDGVTFWYLGEYSKITGNPNGRWGNYIGSFTYPDCVVASTPAIVLAKTVGTDPAVCATTDAITVPAGAEVTYCYTVENTGDVTLGLHDLVDNELGTILSAFPYVLSPGASAFLTSTTTLITTTVNTATWTAYNAGPSDVVTATDTATVTIGITDPANIVVDPLAVSSSQNPDTQTQHTVTISNTGGSDLVWQVVEEPALRSAARPLFPTTLPVYVPDVAAEIAGLETGTPLASLRPSPEARAQAKLALFTTGLLLAPDSTNDRIMALDPLTGDVIDANFVPSNTVVGTGIHAILSASGDSILLSDQTGDVVHEFDLDGNYLGIFAPAGGPNTAIMDNIRGISLDANGNLLVTVAAGANANAIAMFDTAGNYLGNFIANGAGGLGSPFDVYGRTADWLVGGIDSDAIHRYDLTGAYIANLTPVNTFPEQIGEAANGNVLVANFSPSTEEGVIEYTATGAFVGRYDPATLGGYRGVYELPNGHILTTTGTGVHEIDRSGNLVQTKIAGIGGRFIEYVVIQTDCSNPADIPWASVAPTNGTTAAGAATDVTVTLDSTGLAAGGYSGNLCFLSNDPDPGPGNGTDLVVVPVNLTVLQTQFATIELTKTVGIVPGVCAPTSEITVESGDTVYYCFEVSNTGNVPLPLHDLVDDQLGAVITGLAYNLLPGQSVNTVAAGLTISQTIYVTTTNTAVWTAYDGVSFTATDTAVATVNANLPQIGVSPPSLSSVQATNTINTETLTINNSGNAGLSWTIDEAGSVAVPEDILYDNGPLVTHPGGGAGGADESRLQNSTLLMTTLGFGHQFVAGNRMADDFTVPDSGWLLDSVTFYAYQTGSSTSSTITAVYVQIWDGPPNDPGATVVFGDLTTNRMTSTTWSNIYRTSETSVGNTTRPIMASVADLGGLYLPAGTYWFDWMADGTLASGPWAPPITVIGQATTGNGLQFIPASGWGPANDGGSLTQQGLPFIIEGTSASACDTPEDIPWLSVSPDSGSTAVGGSSDVTVTFDSTGLPAGDYAATLCVYSNDPLQPLVEVPITLTVTLSAPAINLTKTVGTDPAVCATTDEITVVAGSTVYYCYEVENTGNVTLNLHDLVDDELGAIFTGLNYALTPGSSVNTVAAGLTISATINVTTTNTATWTAYNAGPSDEATATDSATVNVTPVPAPAITLVKTVGTTPGVCATTTSITVESGTTVYYCYTVTNIGNVALGLHDLADDELGALLNALPFNLLPGASVDTVAAGLTFTATITADTTNTATWTAYNAGPSDVATATASATVTVAAAPGNLIYLPIILKP